MTQDTAAPPPWAARFLSALRDGATTRAACRAAGVTSSTPYHRRTSDAAFRAEWDAILGRGGDRPARGRPADPAAPKRPRGAARLDRFIAELAETSNVAAACAVADLTTSQVYRLRRTDPDFARRWFAALAEGYDNLEMELLGRLRAGEAGEAAKPRFDTATAMRCLAAHRDSVLREKGRRTLADEVATIQSLNEKIDRLRLNQQASDRAIRAARKAVRDRRKDDGDAEDA